MTEDKNATECTDQHFCSLNSLAFSSAETCCLGLFSDVLGFRKFIWAPGAPVAWSGKLPSGSPSDRRAVPGCWLQGSTTRRQATQSFAITGVAQSCARKDLLVQGSSLSHIQLVKLRPCSRPADAKETGSFSWILVDSRESRPAEADEASSCTQVLLCFDGSSAVQKLMRQVAAHRSWWTLMGAAQCSRPMSQLLLKGRSRSRHYGHVGQSVQFLV